jgi:hypothetical protein
VKLDSSGSASGSSRARTTPAGIALVLLAAAVWLATTVSHDAGPTQTREQSAPAPTASSPGPETISASAFYRSYGSVRELDDHSTVVVRATAVRKLSAYEDLPPASASQNKKKSGILLKTDVVFRVVKVIRGDPAFRGRQLKVIHLGGRTGKQRVLVEGEPISRIGKSYVLFLQKKRSRFVVVGGPQGRYLVRGGKLRLVSREFELTPVAKKLGGMRVRDFERRYPDLLRGRFGTDPNSQPLPEEPLGPTPPPKTPVPGGPPPPPA